MPLARMVLRAGVDAALVTERLRALGYTVETVAPDQSPSPASPADLLLELESCSPEDALARANAFALIHDDARILVAPGVLQEHLAGSKRGHPPPAPSAPSAFRTFCGAGLHFIGLPAVRRVAIAAASLAAVLGVAFLVLAVRRPASPLGGAQPPASIEQQLPFGPVTVRSTPVAIPDSAPGRKTPTLETESIVVHGQRQPRRKSQDQTIAEDVVIRHYPSPRPDDTQSGTRVKHFSDFPPAHDLAGQSATR